MRYYDRQGRIIDEVSWRRERTDGPVWVARTPLDNDGYISTVWLGIDHSFSDEGPPILFETMVLDTEDAWDQFQIRYTTELASLRGHARVLEAILARRLPDDIWTEHDSREELEEVQILIAGEYKRKIHL